ncbi:MAG: M15 family metallopeptidase, partial [Gammaproteobacteria bacterium]|nr:M15 family metallopeptidase [Gammaproteobacteria bacterium]
MTSFKYSRCVQFFGLLLSLLVIALGTACAKETSIETSSTHTQSPTNTVTQSAKNPVKTDTNALNVFSIDYLTGQFDPATHGDFVRVDQPFTDRTDLFLRDDAYQAFKKMYKSARMDGITLIIRSATRNFDYQKGIWERKWTGRLRLSTGDLAPESHPDEIDRARRILEDSSMPGTSRHHWGTDIDINAFLNEYFESGRGLEEYEWLRGHAAEFGFCQPYTAKNDQRPYGYNEEKWHWSYHPISSQLTRLAESSLTDDQITGFLGSETATNIEIIKHYVLGLS